MKFTTSTIFAFSQAALAWPQGSSYGDAPAEGVWQAPAADAERGPCPMMNTLANHGFLPRDGKNLTRDNVVHGLNAGIGFTTNLGGIMWDTQAHVANPEPNATFFTLGQLNVHNLLEHDSSLTRTDAAFGSNHEFNQTIFDQTKRFWPDETITVDQLANSKIYRQLESKAFNPQYRFTNKTEPFSLGELAAPILALGDIEAGTVDKKLVEYWIENERLPYELGWSKKTDEVTLEQTMSTSERIGVATSLFTVDKNQTSEEGQHARRSLQLGRDGHFGF